MASCVPARSRTFSERRKFASVRAEYTWLCTDRSASWRDRSVPTVNAERSVFPPPRFLS